jgi:GT2 family glycosyltransferase
VSAAPDAVDRNAAVHLTVSVVIVNLDGAEFLPDCLDSLAAQDYRRELVTVIVVDNGSTDGSVHLLRTRFPWVRVLPQDENIGFAPAVNVGAREATGECLVFLNNDARVDARFLTELTRAYAPAEGVEAVGARIVSWDGGELDFFEGATGLDGMASQIGYGSPAHLTDAAGDQELLFACGGAMLIGRATYLEIGGFDDRFFAYFEDVDLGWRMHVQGQRVVAAPGAVAYHRMHGTSSRFPFHKRVFLYERNALLCLIKNIEHRHLDDVLLGAVFLAVTRTAVRGRISVRQFDIRDPGPSPDTMSVPMTALAPVAGIVDVLDNLDDVLVARHTVQARRRVPDTEILPLLGRTFWPAMTDRGYLQIQERLVSWLRLDRLAPRRRAGRVLVVLPATGTSDAVERLTALADVVSAAASTTVVGSTDQVVDLQGRRDLTVATRGDLDALQCLAEAADIVVTTSVPGDLSAVALASVVRVVDLGSTPPPGTGVGLEEVLSIGDLFLCATDADRRGWMSHLETTGRASMGIGAVGSDGETLVGVWEGKPGSDPGAVMDAVRRPWLWTEARHLGYPRLPTDEVRALMEERNRLFGYLSHSTLSADRRWRRRVGVALAHLLDGDAPVLAERARMSLGLAPGRPWRSLVRGRVQRWRAARRRA